ncbi:hypothetical protein [Pseudomonas sp. Q11]|uniref:hypothetical protein n=1 Tax=Pseudomonas sp. Q11 TaxID=2968470 RepID=UPI00210BBD4C|nr:hypothetical protein [Pseudomonas sp. Q11]MCQ6255416.1 hypothetical protein [Pseudomonas sp. Q11]
MKTVMSLAVLSVACYATADVQKIQYAYDDSKAEYAIVSFTENGSTLQVTVQRSGPYFTNYTKLALDCANRNVRHMGMYNSLERLEKAQFDPMQERIVAGSIADEVRKVLCRGTSMTASQADEVPAKVKADDKI